ncbi:hypothetical protein KOR42_06090 [Thalassoglobus neptunius]|uniref:Uncharacterized protein n=1 Tax=Thalassoglobus neptunius TaxID=1938619 RepID=A0A5C5X4K0_9PLAN|nr:hypothetical protein [Thalassoglobus neptunius]TWT57251.1 hypothetical protein KOR42_06090 [Thalassoglobus neptunius]
MSLEDLIAADAESLFIQDADFGESVTFAGNDAADVTLTAVVVIDRALRDASGTTPTLWTGEIILKASQRDSIVVDDGPLLLVTVRGDSWRVTDVGEPDNGLVRVGIQRELPEHSNAIDLQGVQHHYG